jgi:hypothetical protein
MEKVAELYKNLVLQKMVDDAQNRWPSGCYCKIADGIHSRIAQIFPQA